LSPPFGLDERGKVRIDPISDVGHYHFLTEVVQKVVKMSFVKL